MMPGNDKLLALIKSHSPVINKSSNASLCSQYLVIHFSQRLWQKLYGSKKRKVDGDLSFKFIRAQVGMAMA